MNEWSKSVRNMRWHYSRKAKVVDFCD